MQDEQTLTVLLWWQFHARSFPLFIPLSEIFTTFPPIPHTFFPVPVLSTCTGTPGSSIGLLLGIVQVHTAAYSYY